MATLNLTLTKKNVNPNTTAINVNALIYGSKDRYILIDTRNRLNLAKLEEGENQIVFPIGWHAKIIHSNELSDVILPNQEFDWDHPYMKDYREWGKEQRWEAAFDIHGALLKTSSGNVMHGFELKSYHLQVNRTNLDTRSGVPSVDRSQFRQGNGGW